MNGNQVSVWIAELGIWPLIVVLVPNLLFRRYGKAAGKKRMASLFQAIAVFVITTLAAFIAERKLTDLYLYLGILVVAAVLVIYRKQVFPYTLTCPECGVRLDFRTIYFMDDNLCTDCRAAKVAREEAEAVGDAVEESTGVTDVTSSGDDAGADVPGDEASSDED